MDKPTVNVGCEHVGHGLDGVVPQRGAMAEQRLLVDVVHLRPLHLVQRVDETHEQLEVSAHIEDVLEQVYNNTYTTYTQTQYIY